MILALGEILFDELPGGRRAGGAPFNFAQHLQRMGRDVRFVSAIGGRDNDGTELLRLILNTGLDPNFVQRHPEAPTGRVAVSVDKNGIPAYQIIQNVAYDFIDFDALPAMEPELVYFGSLIQRTSANRKRLHRFLQKLPASTLRFYDVNFRAGCDTADILIPSLEQTDILKLNDDELPRVGALLESSLAGDKLVDWLMDRCSIRALALTCGAKGCTLYRDGQKFEEPPGPLKKEEIVDTVGAGDSFAAAVARGILDGLNSQQILKDATRLAEYVCTIPGAVPDDPAIYESFMVNG